MERESEMQIKHIKNLYWLIFVLTIVVAVVFFPNPFVLVPSIFVAAFAFLSILTRKPAFLWALFVLNILNIPFAIPFLVLAIIVRTLNKTIWKTAYTVCSWIIAVSEFVVLCLIPFGGIIVALCCSGSIVFCQWFIYFALISEEE